MSNKLMYPVGLIGEEKTWKDKAWESILALIGGIIGSIIIGSIVGMTIQKAKETFLFILDCF